MWRIWSSAVWRVRSCKLRTSRCIKYVRCRTWFSFTKSGQAIAWSEKRRESFSVVHQCPYPAGKVLWCKNRTEPMRAIALRFGSLLFVRNWSEGYARCHAHAQTSYVHLKQSIFNESIRHDAHSGRIPGENVELCTRTVAISTITFPLIAVRRLAFHEIGCWWMGDIPAQWLITNLPSAASTRFDLQYVVDWAGVAFQGLTGCSASLVLKLRVLFFVKFAYSGIFLILHIRINKPSFSFMSSVI